MESLRMQVQLKENSERERKKASNCDFGEGSSPAGGQGGEEQK